VPLKSSNTPLIQKQLNTLEQLAKGSKLSRLLHNPYNYALAQAYDKVLYPLTKKGYKVQTSTFWDESFWIELPAALDIYLTGGKTHDSELRLTRYLTETLQDSAVFLDIGSHYGYYARLALHCLNGTGQVIAVEPSKSSFELLQQNLKGYPNAKLINGLMGATCTEQEFWDFPVLYSEYNTVYPAQFEQSRWFKKASFQRHTVPCYTIDTITVQESVVPTFIKIDVEGAELDVLQGAENTLTHHSNVIIAMEYLSPGRSNTAHKQAAALLSTWGFNPFMINADGSLSPCIDLEEHIREKDLESDNIIFQRLG
jgi:FkbM family methyltransferase